MPRRSTFEKMTRDAGPEPVRPPALDGSPVEVLRQMATGAESESVRLTAVKALVTLEQEDRERRRTARAERPEPELSPIRAHVATMTEGEISAELSRQIVVELKTGAAGFDTVVEWVDDEVERRVAAFAKTFDAEVERVAQDRAAEMYRERHFELVPGGGSPDVSAVEPVEPGSQHPSAPEAAESAVPSEVDLRLGWPESPARRGPR